jgi:predicted membrane protein
MLIDSSSYSKYLKVTESMSEWNSLKLVLTEGEFANARRIVLSCLLFCIAAFFLKVFYLNNFGLTVILVLGAIIGFRMMVRSIEPQMRSIAEKKNFKIDGGDELPFKDFREYFWGALRYKYIQMQKLDTEIDLGKIIAKKLVDKAKLESKGQNNFNSILLLATLLGGSFIPLFLSSFQWLMCQPSCVILGAFQLASFAVGAGFIIYGFRAAKKERLLQELEQLEYCLNKVKSNSKSRG